MHNDQSKAVQKHADDLPDKEIVQRRDAALKRALAMPPAGNAAKPKAPAKKRKKASGS